MALRPERTSAQRSAANGNFSPPDRKLATPSGGVSGSSVPGGGVSGSSVSGSSARSRYPQLAREYIDEPLHGTAARKPERAPTSGVRRVSRRGQRIFSAVAFSASAVGLGFVAFESLRPAPTPPLRALAHRQPSISPEVYTATVRRESALAARAASAMAEGRYSEALERYTALATQWPQARAYSTVTEVLRRRLGMPPGPEPAASPPHATEATRLQRGAGFEDPW